MGIPLTFGKFVGFQHSESLKGRRFLMGIGDPTSAPFSATIQLHVRLAEEGIWRPATDSTGNVLQFSASGMLTTFDFVVPVEARLECTTYASGAIPYVLAAQVTTTTG
jgi:hypothetical protein